MSQPVDLSCGLPFARPQSIQMAHGGGGRMMQELISGYVLNRLDNPFLALEHDSAALPNPNSKLAFTTDSYVVKPLFFPGGDIGKLAVFGTINDLAMSGAEPLYLSLAMILEEGLPMSTLERVLDSIALAAQSTGVKIVTGDTKVVESGKGDGVYLTTAGVGVIHHKLEICPASIRVGDRILLSGDLGRHGISIMAAREGLDFETTILSDCAPLHAAVGRLISAGIEVHCLRDLTRGGLASSVCEIAKKSGRILEIDERMIRVEDQVRGACEMLGLDPLYVANEGRFVAFVPEGEAARTLELLRECEVSSHSSIIGLVSEGREGGRVLLKNGFGAPRVLDLLSGEQLPRIC